MKRALIWAIALLIWAGNSNGLEVHKTSILTTQGEKNLVVAQKTLHQTWNIFFLSPSLFRIETDLSLIGSENTNMYKNNVLIDSSRKIIFFDVDLLNSSSQFTIEKAIEHEIMHYLFEFHLPKQVMRAFRTTFCDLHNMKELGDYAWERYLYINKGNLPQEIRKNYRLTQNYRNAKEENFFFAFISEHNYFRNYGGGHPYDDPYEFGASFLHSVQHAEDNFLTNLNRKLHIYPSGKSRPLTKKEKSQIIDHYRLLTYTIYHNLKLTGEKPHLKQYFKDKWELFSSYNHLLPG